MTRQDEARAAGGALQPEPMPADLTSAASAAERMSQEASDLAERASRGHAEAAALVAAAEQEAARILSEARTRAQAIEAEATAAGRKAAPLAERAGWLTNTVAAWRDGEVLDQRVTELEAERDQLTGQVIAELDARLGHLDAERGNVEAQLTAAREACGLEAMQALRGRLDAIDDLVAEVTRQQTVAQDRVTAIGDHERGELAEAIRNAAGRRGAVERALYDCFPDSPEAIQWRQREDSVPPSRPRESPGVSRSLAAWSCSRPGAERQRAAWKCSAGPWSSSMPMTARCSPASSWRRSGSATPPVATSRRSGCSTSLAGSAVPPGSGKACRSAPFAEQPGSARGHLCHSRTSRSG